jgi:hypothetical protein
MSRPFTNPTEHTSLIATYLICIVLPFVGDTKSLSHTCLNPALC